MLPTPKAIIEYLNGYVRGQDRAKQDLAVAVYNHYLSQAYAEKEGSDLGRHHILLIGPTGVGKTYMVKLLAEYLGGPGAFTSATGLVEMGYKGNSVESIIAGLLGRAGGNPQQAEKGIIFIDEIDKIRRRETGGRDVSGEGVQNALLTLMDGRTVSGLEGMRHAPVDTGRLLFIATGAFAGLPEMIEDRIGTGRTLGFQPREAEQEGIDELGSIYRSLCQMETEDLTRYGMIPEMIGRFATLTVLHELQEKDLEVILTDGIARSPWKLQQELAAIHGIELESAPEAFEALAVIAAKLGTGARGLHRLIGKALDSVDYRWAELADEGVTRVLLTPAAVRGEGPLETFKEVRLRERRDLNLRKLSLAGLPNSPRATITDNTEDGNEAMLKLSNEALWESIEKIKEEQLEWLQATGSARIWWEKFETEKKDRPILIHRVINELVERKATINDLFLAFARSGTDNIQANFHYLDYMRLKD